MFLFLPPNHIIFLRLHFQLNYRIFARMNGERIYFSDQNLSTQNNTTVQGTNTHYEHVFKNFLHNFSRENTRVYHKRLELQIRNRKHVLPIEITDLNSFDEHLYERLALNPLQILKVMENTLRTYLKERNNEYPACPDEEWQVILRSDDNPIKIRDIKSSMISRLFVISGIVISSTKPYIKASKLKLQCKNCLNAKTIELSPGQYPYVPSFCEGQAGHTQKCPKDSFVAMPNSEVIDSQNLKIQEFPEDIPTGEVARTYALVVDRKNVSLCVPGDRVRITGVMLVNDLKTDQLNKGYLYVTGIQKIKERAEINYTEKEEEIFKQMSKDPKIYDKIYNSIAPGIFGNLEIKKAIACMLFGGSRKHLPDETFLRGDINILLIGDPSTAKSQFLKFVQQAAAIAVYTSGKGSSAAGLTASITKDFSTGEFQIEGGALVLADGGIVCIDEFDKMKPTDRVAIHEAMEQQTISVAKAGITTRLNSRTSILAAANPIFGRYDNFKQIEEQIELQNTILSRFDCIFIVRDINTEESNNLIATHILDLHQGKTIKKTETDVPFEIMKKYIKYAKAKVNPRLSAVASEKLQDIYVKDRQKSLEQKKLRGSKSVIPITVRQLEAVIRLSESIARMRLRQEVGLEEVEEAHYLFEISTMKTIEGSQEFGYELADGVADDIQKIEEMVRKKVCIGHQVATTRLIDELETSKYSKGLIERALQNMIKNDEMKELKARKMLTRVR